MPNTCAKSALTRHESRSRACGARPVKPSAQPTLVRTQHLPPPRETAPDQHVCQSGLCAPYAAGCGRERQCAASCVLSVSQASAEDTAVLWGPPTPTACRSSWPGSSLTVTKLEDPNARRSRRSRLLARGAKRGAGQGDLARPGGGSGCLGRPARGRPGAANTIATEPFHDQM